MNIQEAIARIEKNTVFRMTAITDKESAFFVPVGNDGKTVIGDVFELSKNKIMKLATLEKLAKVAILRETANEAKKELLELDSRENSKMEQERLCVACLENGHKVPAAFSLPQSNDAGKTVTYIDACDMHEETWWDGADWDGKHLERRIFKG